MIPTLIHPVPVWIQRKVEASSVLDPVAREPVRQVWRTGGGPGLGAEVEVPAQVSFNTDDGFIARPKTHPGGTVEEWSGYLLLRVVDLISSGLATEEVDGTLTVHLARGDRVSRVGRRVTDLFVTSFRDVASYPDQGGATLLEVRFSSRLGG